MSVTSTISIRTYNLVEALNERAAKKRSKATFRVTNGSRYYRILREDHEAVRPTAHAFIDQQTGDVFKAAAFGIPAKGVRFNLLDNAVFSKLLSVADIDGKYLRLK